MGVRGGGTRRRDSRAGDVGGLRQDRVMADFVEIYTGRVRQIVDCAHCGARVERYVFQDQMPRYCSPRCGERGRDKERRKRRAAEARWASEKPLRDTIGNIDAWVIALRAHLLGHDPRHALKRCAASGKLSYPTWEAAWVAAMNDYAEETLNAYRCARCGGCHLGNRQSTENRTLRLQARTAIEAAALRL